MLTCCILCLIAFVVLVAVMGGPDAPMATTTSDHRRPTVTTAAPTVFYQDPAADTKHSAAYHGTTDLNEEHQS